MNSPLVSIICLCYNHAPYVREALESVLSQTYRHVQLIIVDDGSSDESQALIREFVDQYSLASKADFKLILNEKNLGNTAAFNRALEFAQGEYVIDLAADDVLLPDRVRHGVQFFAGLGPKYGVIYCNVELIDEEGLHLANFYPDRKDYHPSGDLFRDLVCHTFVSPPGMMMTTEVLQRLSGYDTSLSYEDYDFWVRSSREFLYAYEDELLVKKRELPHSHSKGFQNERSEVMLRSTLQVCKKAIDLSHDDKDFDAVAEGISYFLRQSALLGHQELATDFMRELATINRAGLNNRFWHFAAKLPLRVLYSLYTRRR